MQHEQTPTRNLQFNYADYQKRNKNLQKSKIDKYYIFQKLGGTGQFGTVYRGMDGVTKKEVALKILDKRAVQQMPSSNIKKLKKRLIENESEIMKKVNSQNVLKLYESLENRDLKIMIIEYCNNGSLFDLLSERGRIPEDEAITLLKQVINGVAECHKMNIIHRDLKLQNILIHNGECKIADFGFSKVLKIQNESETVRNTILGSLLTMAPQVMHKEKYGLKADIWSLGVIFFQLIFGRNPFKFDGKDLNKCFEEGVQLINSQQEYYSIKPSVEGKKFIREVLVIDQQKRLGWRQILNHELFRVQRAILPTRFYRAVNLKTRDSQLELMEKQISKQSNSQISNLNQSQQISIQSIPNPNQLPQPFQISNQQPQSIKKSNQQHQKSQQQTSDIKINLKKQVDSFLKQQNSQPNTLNKLQQIEKTQQTLQNIQPQKTLTKLQKQSNSILSKNHSRKKQNLPIRQSQKSKPKQIPQKSNHSNQNQIASNLLKSSQVLHQDSTHVDKNKIQENKINNQPKEPKKPQTKLSNQREVKIQNKINNNEVKQQIQINKNAKQNMIDRYSLTEQQFKRAHEAINREDSQIYQWAQRIHNQCLRAEFIYNNIVKVIERHNLLDLNDREVIELMYLICTRCRNNISPIYNEYAKRKNNKIIQDLKNLVEPLYRIINGKYNAYSNQLTKKQNGLISIAKDFFPKRFSSDFKRKDHFLTAVQSMEQFKSINAPQKKTVKVGDKLIKEKDLVDYTKQEQIQFTDQCMQKLIPKLKFVESNKELRMTMKNFKKICLLKTEGLKPQIFRLKLKQISQQQ